MKELKKKQLSNLSWIKRGGQILNYYEPETIDELVTLIRTLQANHEYFDLVGLTSNIYFKNTYNVTNLITTKRLTHYYDDKDELYAECGVNVSRLSRYMVNQGVKGFEGLIDLPGTVGGGIYGNSGCYGSLLTDMLISADVLLPDGTLTTFSKDDMGFTLRMSCFKSGKCEGFIIGAHFKKEYGNRDELILKAQKNHEDRLSNQPGPKFNLGTTYCTLGSRTLYGKIIGKISGIYERILRIKKIDDKRRRKKRYEFELRLVGGKCAIPYLFNLQRFMWLDENADNTFVIYQEAINRIFKNPELEIQIKE